MFEQLEEQHFQLVVCAFGQVVGGTLGEKGYSKNQFLKKSALSWHKAEHVVSLLNECLQHCMPPGLTSDKAKRVQENLYNWPNLWKYYHSKATNINTYTYNYCKSNLTVAQGPSIVDSIACVSIASLDYYSFSDSTLGLLIKLLC